MSGLRRGYLSVGRQRQRGGQQAKAQSQTSQRGKAVNGCSLLLGVVCNVLQWKTEFPNQIFTRYARHFALHLPNNNGFS